ncbi:MAG: hypothetical protein AAB417_03955 [Patescibacteria group bacterium]
MSILEFFEPTIFTIKLLVRFWWLWLAPTLFVVFRALWVSWRQQLYKAAIEWTLLELKIPRDIAKSPVAMDQFFIALSSVRNSPGDFEEIYLNGEVTLWFSLEVASFGGDIHFYIRTPKKHRRAVEANLYANYPMLEIEQVSEYLDRFPNSISDMYARNLDLWGTEFVLGKPDAYPIRTYLKFESMDEERSLDPIAALLEVFQKIDRKENYLLQILIQPADPVAWRAEGLKLVDKLKTREEKVIQGPLGEYTDRPMRTPGETEVLKAIELNLAKPGYNTLIRFVYIADKSVADGQSAKREMTTAINQYVAGDMNYFEHNRSVWTQAKYNVFPYFAPKLRAEARKVRMWEYFRERKLPEESVMGKYILARPWNFNIKQRVYVLNTEELATLYHPPTMLVMTGPLIRRIEAKKMGPSVGLEMFEDQK